MDETDKILVSSNREFDALWAEIRALKRDIAVLKAVMLMNNGVPMDRVRQFYDPKDLISDNNEEHPKTRGDET